MEIGYYESEIGLIEIQTKNNFLINLKIVQSKKEENKSEFLSEVKKQLKEYFANKRKEFNIPILITGTEFEKKVLTYMSLIKYGTTISYKELAKLAGNEKACRAVGSICAKNKIFIIIPCHRVIKSNKEISGFFYGDQMKMELLKNEGLHPILHKNKFFLT